MTQAVAAAHHQPTALWWAVGWVGAAYLAGQLLGPASSMGSGIMHRQVDWAVRSRIARACALPAGIAHLENPALLDVVAQLRTAAPGQFQVGEGVVASYERMVDLAGYVGPTILLARWHWWLAVPALVVSVLIRGLSMRRSQKAMKYFFDRGAALRRSLYLAGAALDPGSAKELRLFGLRSWIASSFTREWRAAMRPIWRNRSRAFGVAGLLITINVFVGAGLLLVLLQDVRAGRIGAGGALVVLGATVAVTYSMAKVDGSMAQAAGGAQMLAALRRVEASLPKLTGRRSGAGLPVRQIRFEKVGFGYPASERAVYSELDLTIRSGESLAIVGVNGAGKTTLVKLLLRLYDPTSGAITVDGIPLTEIDPTAWQRQVACVFQDFVRWPFSFRDNVGLGRLGASDAEILAAVGRANAQAVLEAVPGGLDGSLSPRFNDGTDLSGGQWQRVALARAMLAVQTGARVLVLDEPTAALDVRAEADFYSSFLDLTRGLTVILISHRFSSVRRAQRIVVLEAGRIIEDGSHDELVRAGGEYARMFALQAANYRDSHPEPVG